MSIKISHITSEAVTRARLINIQPNIVFQGDDIPPVLADHRHVAVGTRGLQRLLHLCRNGYQGDQGEASSESRWREGWPNLLKQVRWCCSDVKKKYPEFYRKVSDVNSIQPTLRVTGTLIGSSMYLIRLEFSSLIIQMYWLYSPYRS